MFRRKLLLVACLVLSVLGTSVVGVVTAAPASAATCSGNGCNGLDPEAAGCGGAITLASARMIAPFNGADIGSIEMRYSTICGTQWIRVNDIFTDCSGEPCLNDATITRDAGPDGPSITFSDSGRPAAGEPSQWSRMVYSEHERSCGTGSVDAGLFVAFPNGVRGALVCG